MYKAVCERKMRPVLRFDLQGRRVGRFADGVLLRQAGFNTNLVNKCCSENDRLKTYKNTIWILEKDYNDKYLKERIEKAKDNRSNKRKAVLCFSKEGKFIKRYAKASDEELLLDGFTYQNVIACCKDKLTHYSDMIWIYESEYNEDTLNRKLKNANSKVSKTKWSHVPLCKISLDNELLEVDTLKGFTQKGYDRAGVYRCIMKQTETYRGFKFMKLDEYKRRCGE